MKSPRKIRVDIIVQKTISQSQIIGKNSSKKKRFRAIVRHGLRCYQLAGGAGGDSRPGMLNPACNDDKLPPGGLVDVLEWTSRGLRCSRWFLTALDPRWLVG